MSDVTRAIAAATSVAASLDLPASDAIVLHNSNRLALRLTPCDVLARVAAFGQEAAQFEVELAQRLAEAGCPVARLEPRADPRVYTRDGFTVTLWTYYEPVTPHVSPNTYARALERLHAGMREVDVPSPRFTDRITEAEEAVADPDRSPELADADRVFLSGKLASLRRATEAPWNNCFMASRGRAMCSARRTARCSSTLRRAAVDQSSSTSPTLPKRSASTTRTSTKNCWTSAGSSSSRCSQRGAGSLATSFRTGGDSGRIPPLPARGSTLADLRRGNQATGRPVEAAEGHLKAAGIQAATLRSFSQGAGLVRKFSPANPRNGSSQAFGHRKSMIVSQLRACAD